MQMHYNNLVSGVLETSGYIPLRITQFPFGYNSSNYLSRDRNVILFEICLSKSDKIPIHLRWKSRGFRQQQSLSD